MFLQRGLQYTFKNRSFSQSFNIVFPTNNPNEPYFIVIELLPILDAKDKDPHELTSILSDDDVMEIDMNNNTFVSMLNADAKSSMKKCSTLISLTGLMKLIHTNLSSSSNKINFDKYIRNDVLPDLWQNKPQISSPIKQKLNFKPIIKTINKKNISSTYKDLKSKQFERLLHSNYYYIENQQDYINPDQKVSVENCDITVDMLAHILQQKGYPIEVDEMYEKLRDDGFLNIYYRPSIRYIYTNLLRLCTYSDNTGNHTVLYITPAGQRFFVNYYLDKYKLGIDK